MNIVDIRAYKEEITTLFSNLPCTKIEYDSYREVIKAIEDVEYAFKNIAGNEDEYKRFKRVLLKKIIYLEWLFQGSVEEYKERARLRGEVNSLFISTKEVGTKSYDIIILSHLKYMYTLLEKMEEIVPMLSKEERDHMEIIKKDVGHYNVPK